MVLNIVQSKLPRDKHLQDKVGQGYVYTVPGNETERQETNPAQCEWEQELDCVVGNNIFSKLSKVNLLRSRNCSESSFPSVNMGLILYSFCNDPFHYPVQCEHSLSL